MEQNAQQKDAPPEPTALANAEPVKPRKKVNEIATNGFQMMPETLGEAWALCDRISRSALVPDALRGKTEDIFMTISLGTSVGLNWTQALQGIAVIGKRAALWGDHFLGVILASPFYERHEEWYELDGVRLEKGAHALVPRAKYDGLVAFCLMKRRGIPEPSIQAFSWIQAKDAGLTSKDGPWKQHPTRMMQMRARGFSGRDLFADVLKGIGIAEEVMDIPEAPRDVTPAPLGSGNDRVRQLIPRLQTQAPAAPQTPATLDAPLLVDTQTGEVVVQGDASLTVDNPQATSLVESLVEAHGPQADGLLLSAAADPEQEVEGQGPPISDSVDDAPPAQSPMERSLWEMLESTAQEVNLTPSARYQEIAREEIQAANQRILTTIVSQEARKKIIAEAKRQAAKRK